jgi:hypothetical protein
MKNEVGVAVDPITSCSGVSPQSYLVSILSLGRYVAWEIFRLGDTSLGGHAA